MSGRKFVKARGLPWEATPQDIVDFFCDSSVVGGTAGVTIIKNFDGRASGNCFVEMECEGDVEAAIAKDREKIGRRYIEVFEASLAEVEAETGDRTSNGGDTGDGTDDAVVRLRGLPYSATKTDIHDFFSGLEIENNGVLMVTDFSGRSKGECFVQFTTVEDSVKALERNKSNMGHRYIEVFASSMMDAQTTQSRTAGPMPPMGGMGPGRHMRGGGMGMRQSPYDRMGFMGGRGGYGMMRGGYGGFAMGMGMGMPMGMGMGGMRGGRGGRGQGGSVLKMRGLPFQVSEQEIAEWFSSVADPIDILIKYNAEGRPSGDAAVTFASESDATRAMQKNKQNMKHRYIELFFEG